MKAYYKERAPVYGRVYSYPERQGDLRFLEEYIPQQFSKLSVLELQLEQDSGHSSYQKHRVQFLQPMQPKSNLKS